MSQAKNKTKAMKKKKGKKLVDYSKDWSKQTEKKTDEKIWRRGSLKEMMILMLWEQREQVDFR